MKAKIIHQVRQVGPSHYVGTAVIQSGGKEVMYQREFDPSHSVFAAFKTFQGAVRLAKRTFNITGVEVVSDHFQFIDEMNGERNNPNSTLKNYTLEQLATNQVQLLSCNVGNA